MKCTARDAWIGWSPALQRQRIGLLANHSRFLLLPGPRIANLASKILGGNLARLSADWQAIHGQPLLLAETFVDPARFAGTGYRAANWLELGTTRGFAKSNMTYTAHGQSKRVLVYPLHREARAILAGALPHPHLPTTMEVKSMQLTDIEAADLLTRLATLSDPRSRQGQRHTLRSVLAVAACAVISGARGSSAIALMGGPRRRRTVAPPALSPLAHRARRLHRTERTNHSPGARRTAGRRTRAGTRRLAASAE